MAHPNFVIFCRLFVLTYPRNFPCLSQVLKLLFLDAYLGTPLKHGITKFFQVSSFFLY